VPGGIDLHKRQSGVFEKGLPSDCELDPMDAARQQLDADLALQIADLAAQRGLRSVEQAFCRRGQTSRLDDGNEVAKMSELHVPPIPLKYATELTKSDEPDSDPHMVPDVVV
jgi:hypothetical protein